MEPDPTRPAIARLESIPHWNGSSVFGLETVQALLTWLGNPQDRVPAIHITGTNGKGTTSSYLASIAHSAKKSVGLSSSPNLIDFYERVNINGRPIAPDDLEIDLARVFQAADALKLEPSYFEVMMLSGFLAFARQNLDWMMIEVGCGGRLDASNTMKAPRATAITSIGLDHVRLLGDTHEKIATEKAHIFRPGVPAFVGPVTEEARGAITAYADSIRAPVEYFGDQFSLDGDVLRMAEQSIRLPLSELGLVADHQLANAALAARIALSVGFSEREIQAGLLGARWPGRLEQFSLPSPSDSSRRISVLTDGAHNIDGVRAFRQYVSRRFLDREAKRELVYLISILHTKDWEQMLGELIAFERDELSKRGVAVQYVFTTSENPNAVDPQELRGFVGRGDVISNPESAFAAALDRCSDAGLVLVTGSLYLLGRLRPQFTSAPISLFCD